MVPTPELFAVGSLNLQDWAPVDLPSMRQPESPAYDHRGSIDEDRPVHVGWIDGERSWPEGEETADEAVCEGNENEGCACAA